jgi:type IV secretory pathway protease TraF
MLRLCWAIVSFVVAIWHALRGLPRRAAISLGASGPEQHPDPARLWKALAVAIPASLFSCWAMPRLHIVMSPSIDAWIVIRAPGPIARGDYVQFTLNHPVAGPTPVSVTKHALCMPGDRLTVVETPSASAPSQTDGHYFCNGVALGTSLPVATDGKRLDHLRQGGIIPQGKVYVGSSHPRGFDSRYLGLVSLTSLQRMRRLL